MEQITDIRHFNNGRRYLLYAPSADLVFRTHGLDFSRKYLTWENDRIILEDAEYDHQLENVIFELAENSITDNRKALCVTNEEWKMTLAINPNPQIRNKDGKIVLATAVVYHLKDLECMYHLVDIQERQSEKIKCDKCCCSITRKNMRKHKKTKKHKQNRKLVKTYCIF